MNRLHVLVLLAAMACTGLVMGTVKAEAADSGKELRAAVNATAPPFAFMENGKLVGFEVDLHAEVAKRMGKQLVMTNIPFAGLAPGLQAKKWDAAGNTWINKERLVMMDFSDPWVDRDPEERRHHQPGTAQGQDRGRRGGHRRTALA